MIQLPEHVYGWLDGQCFVSLATTMRDGQPHLSLMWAERDGAGHILMSTAAGKQKHRNILREPRVSLLLRAPDDPYLNAEIRGIAHALPDENRSVVNRLYRKYQGGDVFPHDRPGVERVILRVTPQKLHLFT
jgi:PPOX class probable F420-dependent enzyme